MKEKIIENNKTYICEFNSINEFYEYLKNTQVNSGFKKINFLSSENKSFYAINFTGTKSLEEAYDLLKNGWDDMSKRLEKRLKAKNKIDCKTQKVVSAFDVCGYQASVPRYLQGIPTSMVNKKSVMAKQKVVTINKGIDYSSYTSKEAIIEESVKAFSIIKKLEFQGIMVNLNILSACYDKTTNKKIICKIRVKNANERFNVSKLSFCFVHPSMLRRIFFKYLEVCSFVSFEDSYFVKLYGIVIDKNVLEKYCSKEYLLPNFINKNVENIKDIECFYCK